MPNKTLVAIGAVTTIIIICLLKDINGALVGSGLAIIAGLGGYAFGKIKK